MATMSQARLIDLSMPISNRIITDPPIIKPTIEYTDHREGAEQMLPFFPGLTASDLPDGEGWAAETLTLSTHSGTHVDAPWHYHSTTDDGRTPSPTIDEAPLDLFFRPGVKLDFRHLKDGYVAKAKDIEDELDRIEYKLCPKDIVLINTSAAAAYGSENYVNSGCGIGREATLYLTEYGIEVVGTDAWSWDAPFSYTARRYSETADATLIWEGHKAGRIRPYYQMEKLHNLEALPSFGFRVICFPIKIERASAGWTRAVAMID